MIQDFGITIEREIYEMKKIVSIVLTLAMILSMTGSVFAIDATGLEAEILESTHVVNVTGQMLDREGTLITVLLVNNEKNIKHIEEVELEADGTYRAKFVYKGTDFADLKLRVKQGSEDVTDTVISAIAKAEPIEYKINISNAEGKTVLDSKIENYFNVPGKTYTIMTAYYDENNKLLDVFVQNTRNLGFEENKDSVEYTIPENAEDVKVFIWNDEETMVPLRDEIKVSSNLEPIRILMIGNSFTDDSRSYLKDVAAADGVELIIDHATYGGGGFTHHWKTWSAQFQTQEEAEAYDKENGLKVGTTPFRTRYHGQVKKDLEGNILTDEFGENMTEFTKSIDDFLDNYTYDFVSLHTLGGVLDPETYVGSADDLAGQNMVKYIRNKQPTAEIVLLNTWAYEKQSTGYLNKNAYGYGTTFDQDKMWDGVLKIATHNITNWATLTAENGLPVSLDGKPIKYIPAGQAFNIARESILFDTTYIHGYTNQASSDFAFVDPSVRTLHRDSYHCSYGYGKYFLALVWYGCLSGNSVLHNKYEHKTYKIPEVERQILKEAAQKAIDDTGIWN